ncbi:MAG TPA: GDSL-type esterase/lipase family protein [Flavilitoribacter sp.]|nr:GDSL-type esterase/lipase family protein [Flavilitoribacter sp.]
MRRSYPIFSLVFSLILICCSTTKTGKIAGTLTGADLFPYGRSVVNDQGEVELISSASNFGFRFKGTECRINFRLAEPKSHSYLQYELDGVYQERIRIEADPGGSFVISAPKDGHHTIWLYKATEAHTGPVFIQSVTGDHLQPLKRPDAPMIEFIGDSITCGAAADASETPCGAGVYHDQHSAYFAYGPRVARALKTNFMLSSISGYGVYRNWNSDGPPVPQVYGKTDFQDNSSRMWDFGTYSPTIVSIALGTNDMSNGDGKKPRLPFDSTTFVNRYVDFVQLVKSKYPQAQIALLSSPMMNGKRRAALQNCLSAVKGKVDALYPSDQPVAVYFFKPMQAGGCTGHPNVEDHGVMAEELVPFFRKLLE